MQKGLNQPEHNKKLSSEVRKRFGRSETDVHRINEVAAIHAIYRRKRAGRRRIYLKLTNCWSMN